MNNVSSYNLATNSKICFGTITHEFAYMKPMEYLLDELSHSDYWLVCITSLSFERPVVLVIICIQARDKGNTRWYVFDDISYWKSRNTK